jgi:hypothetical protein
MPAMIFDGAPHDLVMEGQAGSHPLRVALPEPGRALDISEKERHDTAGDDRHHRRRLNRRLRGEGSSSGERLLG